MRTRNLAYSPNCRHCTKKALYPRHYCQRHREMMRRSQLKHLGKGLCMNCHAPALPDRTRCAYHLQKEAKEAQRRAKRSVYTRPSRWNEDSATLILRFVYQNNPYLHRDWDTAKPFILKHYKLWISDPDNAWSHRFYFNDWANWENCYAVNAARMQQEETA